MPVSRPKVPTRVTPYQLIVEAALAMRAADLQAYTNFCAALLERVHDIAYECVDTQPQRLEHMQGRAVEARDLVAVLSNLSTVVAQLKEVKKQ